MSERVVIVGGGMSGLVAAWVFMEHGQSPVVLEPKAPGGDFLMGGLKYIHKTHPMMDMLDGLEVTWDEYTVSGGILLRGAVLPFPDCLDGMAPDESARIQADHFRKTRRMDIGSFGSRSMNDPGSGKSDRRALRCDPQALVNALVAETEVVKTGVQRIERNRVQLTDGSWMPFDKLVVTIPLWVAHQICDWYLPEGMAMLLNIVRVAPWKDPFAKWDYVYTPYTPGDAIHRLSAVEGGWDAEVNGEWDSMENKTMDDLASLFPAGFRVVNTVKGIKGHLLELPEAPKWPDHIAPLGRFAKWDPRATTDVTLDDAVKLATRWGWTR
jgi:hypothetical protein